MRHSVWDTLVNAGHVYLPVKLERHVKARAASLCASKRRFFSNSSRIPHFKISDIYLSSPTHRLSLNIENLGRVEQSVQARQNQSSGRDIYKPINFCMQHTMRFAIPSTMADFFSTSATKWNVRACSKRNKSAKLESLRLQLVGFVGIKKFQQKQSDVAYERTKLQLCENAGQARVTRFFPVSVDRCWETRGSNSL